MNPDNTNTLYLSHPRYAALATYGTRDTRLFKCPADTYASSPQRARGWNTRVRSVAQNLWVANGNATTFPTDGSYDQVTSLMQLVNPKPAGTWLSLDEHPDSINDGALLPPQDTVWPDLPGSYHDGATSVAFADGHVEMHRWEASVLRFPITFSGMNNYDVPADDPDIQWLRSRTPRKAGMN